MNSGGRARNLRVGTDFKHGKHEETEFNGGDKKLALKHKGYSSNDRDSREKCPVVRCGSDTCIVRDEIAMWNQEEKHHVGGSSGTLQ